MKKEGLLKLSSMLISLSLLTGCNTFKSNKITVLDDYTVSVNDDSTYIQNDIKVKVNSNDDLSWLNNCKRLKSLTLIINTEDNTLDTIKSIDNLETLVIYDYTSSFNIEKYEFIKDCKNLKSLYYTDNGKTQWSEEKYTFLNSIDEKVHKSIILSIKKYSDIDFTKLANIKGLIFIGFRNTKPYDLGIYLTTEDINTIKSKGIDLRSIDEKNNNLIYEVKEINKKLDAIIKSLSIKDETTEEDKLKAITCYILETMSYNNNISANEAYQNGYLYEALENNSGICGSYAALFEALAKRTGIESYLVSSRSHAWNLINYKGEYKYIDSTSLDTDKNIELVKLSGEYFTPRFYLEDLFSLTEYVGNRSYNALTIPEYLNLEYGYMRDGTFETIYDKHNKVVYFYDEDGNTIAAIDIKSASTSTVLYVLLVCLLKLYTKPKKKNSIIYELK